MVGKFRNGQFEINKTCRLNARGGGTIFQIENQKVGVIVPMKLDNGGRTRNTQRSVE